MKYLIPPVSLRKRDREIAKLLRRGTSTDDELFAAQFRDWPARGLNKDVKREGQVDFKDYWKDSDNRSNVYLYLMSLGYVDDDTKERELFLNRLLLSPLGHVLGVFSTRLAYARFHDALEILVDGRPSPAAVIFIAASLMSSYRFAAGSSLTQMLAPSLGDVVGHEHIHVLQLKDKISRVKTTNFLAAAELMIKSGDEWTRMKQFADTMASWLPRVYYSIDHELQARLHTIMVQGYRSWGRLPQTESELIAALRDRGIKAPKVERQWLAAKEQTKVRRDFSRLGRWGRTYFNPASAEINVGLNSHQNVDVLEAYWSKFLPSLYADLLVLYGDSQGHQRMGFDNPSAHRPRQIRPVSIKGEAAKRAPV